MTAAVPRMAKVLATARVDGMFVLGSGVATLNLSTMGDESCSEVSSSSPLTSPGALSPPALVSVGVSVGMSPPTSLASSDIGEVDLDFWDLDLNSPSPPHGMASVASTNALLLNPRAVASPSDTSSLSGIVLWSVHVMEMSSKDRAECQYLSITIK